MGRRFARHTAFTNISRSPPESATSPALSKRSKIIGNYKLLQKLGEGGMGTVWMAEQERPVRRRVALKLIKSGLDDQQVLARFEAERQALAMMDHPNIARVLDAGATESGQPFFVMELVNGIPLTEYCDDNRLSLNERLELFHEVCQAVQHAHQKGIIHRDLKPTNILVALHDGQPVPKVIDFGLAKALQQQTKLSERTLFTEFGQVVGTLRYMSPEQAELNALDIDTRADIYSLGVILYELLTGSTPLDKEFVSSQPVFKVLDAIRVKDAPRPSTRLSSATHEGVAGISAQRQIDSRKFQKILRGELDWIAMKALDKDRARRYTSAADFASDIRRYLDGEAVQARPPSAAYRVRKFAKRHRGLLAVATGVMLLIGTGLVGIGYFWSVANRAQKDVVAAQQQTSKVEQRKKEVESSLLETQMARDVLEVATKQEVMARQEAEQRRHSAEEVTKSLEKTNTELDKITRLYDSKQKEVEKLLFSLMAEPLIARSNTSPDERAKHQARILYKEVQNYQKAGNIDSGKVEATLACGIIALGYPQQARQVLSESLTQRQQTNDKQAAQAWRIWSWCNEVAEVLNQAKQFALAEELLVQAMKSPLPASASRTPNCTPRNRYWGLACSVSKDMLKPKLLC